MIIEILEMDEKSLPEDKIKMLLEKFPTADEVSMIKQSNLETVQIEEKIEESDEVHVRSIKEKWAKPEEFCLIISSIPNVKLRLRSWLFMNSFQESLESLDTSLDIYLKACQELTRSKTLREIFSLILACGNYMNGGTNKGQADGFDLQTLSKLHSVKDSTNSQTLLSYVSKIASQKILNSRSLNDELSNVILAAKKSQLIEIKMRCLTLINMFKRTENDCKLINKHKQKNGNDERNDDMFNKKATQFMNQNSGKIKQLSIMLEKTIGEYETTLKYFCDKEHKMNTSNEFMKMIADFTRKFVQSMPPVEDPSQKKTSHNKNTQLLSIIDFILIYTNILTIHVYLNQFCFTMFAF